MANSIKDLHYHIRISPKAEVARLVVKPHSGLEVVLPRSYDLCQVPALVAKHEAWIRQKLLEYPPQAQSLPSELQLLALEENWQINYHQQNRFSLQEVMGSLIVAGDLNQIDQCYLLLKKWLIHRARKSLPSLLRQVSIAIDLPYRKTTVRSQKTIWASCSKHKDISLNHRLIFVDPPTLRYIFIHELCHTIHLNHSPQFWQLVAQHEPNYLALDKSLKAIWRNIPL